MCSANRRRTLHHPKGIPRRAPWQFNPMKPRASVSKEVWAVINASWRKRFSILQNRLYLYPAPEPLERTRLFWIATGLVSFMVLAFCTYFILYLTGRHDALMTSAEDLGIMDQALWNQVH